MNHMMNQDEYVEDSYESAMMSAPAPEMGAESLDAAMPTTMGMQDAVMTESGEFAPEWYSRFDELKPFAPTLAKFRRPEALAKSYAALERMKGYPGVENEAQMASFRRSVGLPESADEYAIPRPENTPDEFWNEGFTGELAQLAYQYGVPAAAMEALAEKYCGECGRMVQEHQRREQESIAQADADLQLAWGTQYDDNMGAVGGVLERLGHKAGVDVHALAENPALRANADFAKLMLEVVGMMQEAPIRTGSPSNSKDEAYRIAHDPAHPLHEAYMRTSHPQHRYANEQYDRFAFGRRI